MPPPALWHYTTEATATVLGDEGLLYPAVQLVPPKDLSRSPHLRAENMARQLIWLTDLEELDCVALRLAPGRVYHRYSVVAGQVPVLPWSTLRTIWPKPVVEILEIEGTMPEHWFVSRRPVPVIHSSYEYC